MAARKAPVRKTAVKPAVRKPGPGQRPRPPMPPKPPRPVPGPGPKRPDPKRKESKLESQMRRMGAKPRTSTPKKKDIYDKAGDVFGNIARGGVKVFGGGAVGGAARVIASKPKSKGKAGGFNQMLPGRPKPKTKGNSMLMPMLEPKKPKPKPKKPKPTPTPSTLPQTR